jgi:hypothetical protein
LTGPGLRRKIGALLSAIIEEVATAPNRLRAVPGSDLLRDS